MTQTIDRPTADQAPTPNADTLNTGAPNPEGPGPQDKVDALRELEWRLGRGHSLSAWLGGGRALRDCLNPEDLPAALQAARSEHLSRWRPGSPWVLPVAWRPAPASDEDLQAWLALKDHWPARRGPAQPWRCDPRTIGAQTRARLKAPRAWATRRDGLITQALTLGSEQVNEALGLSPRWGAALVPSGASLRLARIGLGQSQPLNPDQLRGEWLIISPAGAARGIRLDQADEELAGHLAAALEIAALQTAALETAALETAALETAALETAALETAALETAALETADLHP